LGSEKLKTSFTKFYSVFITGVIVYTISIFCYAQVRGNEERSPKIPQSIEELKIRIDRILNETNIPGAAVAIVSTDSIIWIGTFGFANRETGERVTENTHFCLGSCTKSFTGLGFLKLLDEGRIDLSVPVREIAPEIEIDNPWQDTDPVRIVHLLEHTAGFDDGHPNWFYFEGPSIPLKSALKIKAHLREVRWRPGTRFGYSSPGFTLAGYVLEKVSNQPYQNFMKQAILNPIGMKTSTIGSSEDCRRSLAVGYDKEAKPYPTWYDYDEPAGALNSSIKEMAVFVRFMLNRGAVGEDQIISRDSFDRIGKPETTLAALAGLRTGYSFGIRTKYRHGAKWYGHGGAVPGFITEYAYNLDHGLGFVVMQNSFDILFNDEIFSVVWDYMDSLVKPSPPPQPVSLSANQLNAYCGYYEPGNPSMKIMGFADNLTGGLSVFCENDKFYTKGFMDTKQVYVPVTEKLFRRPQDPEATAVFTVNSEGGMIMATRGSYYEKTSKWKPVVYRIFVFGALIIMISSIVYSLFWIPVHVYKKIKKLDSRSKYIRMRLIPLFALLSLAIGITVLIGAEPTILELGQKTTPNVIFFISTWLFAGLSALSLLVSIKGFFKPVKKSDCIYAFIVSLACFAMALYLYYWDVIGLRLWAY
jgi:CubicO group peptidase (beta-lactamase class C family)